MPELNESIFKDSEEFDLTSSKVGTFGEKLAVEFIQRNGLKVIASNFKVPIGRNRRGVLVTGEIDLIGLDENTVSIIEVKTRSDENFSSPFSAIDLRKQRQIIRTTRVFKKTFNLEKYKFRYDAVGIILNGIKAPTIKYIKSYWNEDKFKKKLWSDYHFSLY
jgi:putative endonuclease